MQRHEGGYYIRLLARDRPGTAATIAKRLAEQKISLESIVQRHPKGEPVGEGKAGAVPVILITYATSEDAVRKALAAVGRDRVISGSPQARTIASTSPSTSGRTTTSPSLRVGASIGVMGPVWRAVSPCAAVSSPCHTSPRTR